MRGADAFLKGKVLAVFHRQDPPIGVVQRMLIARGYAIDRRRPIVGDPLPTSLADYCGVIVFGGTMSANDNARYMADELALAERAIDKGVPYLGICLGAQILTRAAGGRVFPLPGGTPQIGYHTVSTTGAGRARGPWPTSAFQWHGEGFEVPASCDVLLEGPESAQQAVLVGDRAIGLQFHPEVTEPIIRRWAAQNAAMLRRAPATCLETMLYKHDRLGRGIARWLGGFLDEWIARQEGGEPPHGILSSRRSGTFAAAESAVLP